MKEQFFANRKQELLFLIRILCCFLFDSLLKGTRAEHEQWGTLGCMLSHEAVLTKVLEKLLADRLQEMGVGLVFHSGHVNDHEIKTRYPQAECCLKPVHTSRLKAALQQAAPLADC